MLSSRKTASLAAFNAAESPKTFNKSNIYGWPGLIKVSALEPTAAALHRVFQAKLRLDTLVWERIEIDLSQLTEAMSFVLKILCLIVCAFWLGNICLASLRSPRVTVWPGAWTVQIARPTCDQSGALSGQRKDAAKGDKG